MVGDVHIVKIRKLKFHIDIFVSVVPKKIRLMISDLRRIHVIHHVRGLDHVFTNVLYSVIQVHVHLARPQEKSDVIVERPKHS